MVNEMSYLPQQFTLSSELIDQLSNRTGCQRCVFGNHGELLLVVHAVPEPGVPERKALFFRYDEQKKWQGSQTAGLGELQQLLEQYAHAIDVHEAVVDDADTAKEIFTILRHAGPLARSARNLFLTLQEAAARLPKDRELRSMRDRAHENERASELLYADAKVALEFFRAERAEEQARSSERLAQLGFRLNLLAGFFLPLVALGGLMGMNVKLPDFVTNAFWWIFFGGLLFGILILIAVGYRTGEREEES